MESFSTNGHERGHITTRHTVKEDIDCRLSPFCAICKIPSVIAYNDCPLMEEYIVFGFRLLIFLFEYIITINVPLFKKLRDIIFFLRDNNFLSHFKGHFEGAKTFLTP